MGASGWSYYTPYQPDPDAALQALRARVFASGKFYRRKWNPRELKLADITPPDPDLTEDDLEGFREELAAYHALEDPTTIERLLAWNAEEGTHSILDVRRAVAEPPKKRGFGVASPLPSPKLLELFGTL